MCNEYKFSVLENTMANMLFECQFSRCYINYEIMIFTIIYKNIIFNRLCNNPIKIVTQVYNY